MSVYKKTVQRGVDTFGKYWSVMYSWEIDGKEFAFGSSRFYEDFLPEEEYVGLVSEATLRVIMSWDGKK